MPTIDGKHVPYNAKGIQMAKRAKKKGKKVTFKKRMMPSDAAKMSY